MNVQIAKVEISERLVVRAGLVGGRLAGLGGRLAGLGGRAPPRLGGLRARPYIILTFVLVQRCRLNPSKAQFF